MAQSANELDIEKKKSIRKKSASNMAATRDQMMEMDPQEVFEWEVDMLESGLKELNVTVGVKWTKPKKAYELFDAIRQLQVLKESDQSQLKSNNPVQSTDSNVLMVQAILKAMEAAEERARKDREAQNQAMEAAEERAQKDREAAEERARKDREVAEERAREDREAQNQAMEAQNKAMEAIAEKVGAAQDINPSRVSGGDSKSRAKGRHPDKLERDIDYATFLQWEKSWNLYVISDELNTLSDPQKTAIFSACFQKNCSAIWNTDLKLISMQSRKLKTSLQK